MVHAIYTAISYAANHYVVLLKNSLTLQQPDAEWQSRIAAIQDASVTAEDATQNVYHGFKVLRNGPKRGRVPNIPEVHTFHATEVSTPELEHPEHPNHAK